LGTKRLPQQRTEPKTLTSHNFVCN